MESPRGLFAFRYSLYVLGADVKSCRAFFRPFVQSLPTGSYCTDFFDNAWEFPLLYPFSPDKFAVSCHEPLSGRRPVPIDLLVIRTSACHDTWAGFRPAF